MRVLGISGKMGSGKDAIYENILRPRGWRHWSFAHTMKAMGMGYGYTLEELTVTKPPHVRKWLQEYGTEQHRDAVHEDFWLRVTDYWLGQLSVLGVERVAFTDVRFPNEAHWVRDHGGMLVRVEGWGGNGPGSAHPSETALDRWTDWDCVIQNHEPGFAGAMAELTAAGVL